jgi:amidase
MEETKKEKTTTPKNNNTQRTHHITYASEEKIRLCGEQLGFKLDKNLLTEYTNIINGGLAVYEELHKQPNYQPLVNYPRTPGYRPSLSENKYGAWAMKTSLKVKEKGKLAGKKIVLKDNIALAGVKMMNGAKFLETHTPDIDATVAVRILEEGGEIVGKAHCEYLCCSGGSHTNAQGSVKNPYNMDHSSGGSSSGCGVIVSIREADMAVGGDQGGSIRIPSCWCGIYGMKPTHGLVPYTGAMGMEHTIDHLGPMTNSVYDNALFLEVLAGRDGFDTRQTFGCPEHGKTNYVQESGCDKPIKDEPLKGITIGVLKEGFWGLEKEVDEKVLSSIEHFKTLGATVKEVSIEMHKLGGAIFSGIFYQGFLSEFKGKFGHKDLYDLSTVNAFDKWTLNPDILSETIKVCLTTGQFLQNEYQNQFYAKTRNLARKFKEDYEKCLTDECDVVVMPTLPIAPTKLPETNCDLTSNLTSGFNMIANTAGINATGHPAMTVPCGMVNGLPIGMMLVSKDYQESLIYKVAYAFEQTTEWKKL